MLRVASIEEESTMSNINEVVVRYVAAWNERESRRTKKFSRGVAEVLEEGVHVR